MKLLIRDNQKHPTAIINTIGTGSSLTATCIMVYILYCILPKLPLYYRFLTYLSHLPSSANGNPDVGSDRGTSKLSLEDLTDILQEC